MTEEPLSPLVPLVLILAAALVSWVRQWRDQQDPPRDKPW